MEPETFHAPKVTKNGNPTPMDYKLEDFENHLREVLKRKREHFRREMEGRLWSTDDHSFNRKVMEIPRRNGKTYEMLIHQGNDMNDHAIDNAVAMLLPTDTVLDRFNEDFEIVRIYKSLF